MELNNVCLVFCHHSPQTVKSYLEIIYVMYYQYHKAICFSDQEFLKNVAVIKIDLFCHQTGFFEKANGSIRVGKQITFYK